MESNYERMCRTCMGDSKNMFPLFTDTKDMPNFPEMIMALTTVKISEGDGLPFQLCMQCASSLDSALNFKKICEQSDLLFRQQGLPLRASELKQEAIDEDECGDDYNVDDFMMPRFKAEPEIEISEDKIVIEERVKRSIKKAAAGTTLSCGECGKTYSGTRTLKRHMAIHSGEGYTCSRCKRVFSRRDHLKKHLVGVHAVVDVESLMNEICAKQITKYNCQHCSVDTTNKAMLAKHMRACHRDKLPKRKNAVSTGETDSESEDEKPVIDLRRTVGTVTTVGGGAVATIKQELGIPAEGDTGLTLEVKYSCGVCGVHYDNQRSYAAHMTSHAPPIPKGQTEFGCNECDKVFSKRKSLKQHAFTHNKEKENKCTLCEKAFTRPDQLILHMKNHTGKMKHQCPHCEKGFNMSSTLKDHLRSHSGEKPYLCAICGKGFSQNTNLRQHLMRHSSTKRFGCVTCRARFVSKGELDSHVRKHTGDHPFVCDTCGTGFTTSSSLAKHKRIHSGEKPYACDFCPQRFTALGTLKNHRRTHTGEKPYKCTHCTRAFAQKSDMVSHIRTHTGERPYVCATCGSAYQQSSALKAHVRSRHPHAIKTVVRVMHAPVLPPPEELPIMVPESSQSSVFTNSDSCDVKYNIPDKFRHMPLPGDIVSPAPSHLTQHDNLSQH